MRTDVKVGVLISLVLVVAAGWYYLRKSSGDEAIPLGAELASSDAAAPEGAAPATHDPDDPQVIRRGVAGPSSPGQTPGARPGPSPDPGAPTGDTFSAAPAEPAADPHQNLFSLGSSPEEEEGPTPPASTLKDLLRLGQSGPEAPSPTGAVARSETPATAPPGSAPTTIRDGGPAVAGRKTPKLPPPHAGAADTPSAGERTHTVGKGDTLSILAEVYYGSQRYTGLIARANPRLVDANHLPVGTVLRIPPLKEGRPTAGAPVARRPNTYVVGEGDTFYGIAERLLGSGARWTELFELNKQVVKGDPKHLRPGQVLELPPSSAGNRSGD